MINSQSCQTLALPPLIALSTCFAIWALTAVGSTVQNSYIKKRTLEQYHTFLQQALHFNRRTESVPTLPHKAQASFIWGAAEPLEDVEDASLTPTEPMAAAAASTPITSTKSADIT